MPLIKTNGIDFYYEERGNPSTEPLLMIMGITAPGSVWEPHTLEMEKHFRCIIGDNRGVGLTEKPAGSYTTDQMADDYAGLLDSLGIEKAKVIGCSMGSTIAQKLAIRHPEKVVSLVLMCPWARCDNTAQGIFQHLMACKAHLNPKEFTRYIQLLIYSKASWDDDKVAAELAEGRENAHLDPNPQPFHGLVGQAHACINHNALEDLHKIKQKTLVIGGKEDIFTPVWMADEVSTAIPNAELYLYEKAGHIFHFENLEDFNKRVSNWLLNS
ncbi:alpha/beta hydrolase [Lacihabitans sp. LS3-19]|uniref:alpha/beta fold hydrolase n=1 Tax=Lacihabitans sp. LS3-19 TaxID=2487335 RepID=UPI0020CBF36E|nr:alpha/beta hydrolase [Lacihabitans sp. LS3-19]MCP9770637.1 alpha/beta hydrolase [Lacihabitans sp. LS3-19]